MATDNIVRDGFAVLPGFLAEGELPSLRSLIAEAVNRNSQTEVCARPHNALRPLRWKDSLIQVLLASNRRIRALSELLNTDDLRWISGYISTKEPQSPPLWWHQDWWCWDHVITFRRAAVQVAVLCYVSETNEQNGALRVLPGSHVKSAPIHTLLPEAHNRTPDELGIGHAVFANIPGQQTLCVAAGDAIVLDYRLLHSTHANLTDRRRDCVLLSFTPSWRQLPIDIRAHLTQHPAQPSNEERFQATVLGNMLPTFDGALQSLSLNRNAPPVFEIT